MTSQFYSFLRYSDSSLAVITKSLQSNLSVTADGNYPSQSFSATPKRPIFNFSPVVLTFTSSIVQVAKSPTGLLVSYRFKLLISHLHGFVIATNSIILYTPKSKSWLPMQLTLMFKLLKTLTICSPLKYELTVWKKVSLKNEELTERR